MGETLGILAVILSGAVVTSNGVTNEILAGAALVGLVSGVASAIYAAKNKATVTALRDAAEAWRVEVAAKDEKVERLTDSLRESESRRATAEARTDITRLETLVTSQHGDLIEVLKGIKDLLAQGPRS